MAEDDAVLQGGPRSGTTFAAEGAALVELEIDGLAHRYIRTGQTRGDSVVYNYDGVVDPGGAQDGAERSHDRVATRISEGEDES